MKTRLVVAFLLLLLSDNRAAFAASSSSQGTVCWPLGFAGVVLGVTTDSQVQRLLGQGIFRKDEGDTGGRYFIDPQGRATLHTVSYTDGIVGELTISSGIDAAIIRSGERKRAMTRWFHPKGGFGNWSALHLGSSKTEVLKNLGKPRKQVTSDNWIYSTTCTCELPQYFTLLFHNGQLVKVIFSAPPG